MMVASQSSIPPVETTGGSFDQAIANGRALLKEHPELALEQAKVILNKDQKQPKALRLAAAAHRALGQADLAGQAELIAIKFSNQIPALAKAAKALGDGDFGAASKLAAEHLAAEPDDLAALALSAESAIAIGVSDKAIPMLQKVLKRAPDFHHAEMLLASALMQTDQLKVAHHHIENLLNKAPEDIKILHLKARLLDGMGDFEGAVATTGRIKDLLPQSATAWLNHGNALRFCGRKAEAIKAFRKATNIDPGHGQSWWAIADLDASQISDSDLELMAGELSRLPENHSAAFNMHIAMGIAHHIRDEYAQAFSHFSNGNALRVTAESFNPNEFSVDVKRHLEALLSSPPPSLSSSPEDGRTPIFIIGMPRAGSTLLERILGEHSQIEPLGEMQIIPRMVQRIQQNVGEEGLAAEYARLPGADLLHLGRWYGSRASELAKTELTYFTDKLHMNWRHLGLIMRMRPDAKLIDIRRDPLDCCWSNFRTLFARGYPAAHDLAWIGHFYKEYAGFCDQLRSAYPDRMHLIEYEGLVEDPDAELTSLMDYLGLEFEPQMLEFHRSNAPVATASSEQVRQPLNRKGIGVAKPYETWLGPLRQALGELAQD